MKPVTIIIRGSRWRLVRTRRGMEPSEKYPKGLWGYCKTNGKGGGTIAVRPSEDFKNRQAELDTLIHEMMHAAHWDLAEEAVHETARDLAAALVKAGVAG